MREDYPKEPSAELWGERFRVGFAAATLVCAVLGVGYMSTGEREPQHEAPTVVTEVPDEIKARCAGQALPMFCEIGESFKSGVAQ